MSDCNALKFVKLVLNEDDIPIYHENNANEVLCEVLTPEGSHDWAYVNVKVLSSHGVVIPSVECQKNQNEIIEKIKIKNEFSNLDDSDDEIGTCGNLNTSHDDNDDDCNTQVDSDFIWSTYRSTPRDNEATEKFIEIVTSDLYQQKLKDKRTPKYKVWQDISIELHNLGYKVAANEKESGKKCDQKWRNLENKYIAFKDNANKTGEAAKKKPMYYDVMHAIKDKHKVSPPTLLDTLKANSTIITPLNNTLESTSQADIVNFEIANPIITKGMHKNNKKSLKPKSKVSPSDILDHMTKQHKEVLDMQEKHYEHIKENMIIQNNQRQEMLNIFAKLVENTTRKKRRRSDSD